MEMRIRIHVLIKLPVMGMTGLCILRKSGRYVLWNVMLIFIHQRNLCIKIKNVSRFVQRALLVIMESVNVVQPRNALQVIMVISLNIDVLAKLSVTTIINGLSTKRCVSHNVMTFLTIHSTT